MTSADPWLHAHHAPSTYSPHSTAAPEAKGVSSWGDCFKTYTIHTSIIHLHLHTDTFVSHTHIKLKDPLRLYGGVRLKDTKET